MTESDVRQKIIESARRRFEHFGYKKTAVDEIASDVGISKGAVYLHFSNKEAILYEVIQTFIEEKLKTWGGMAEGDEPALEKIKKMAIWWMGEVIQKRDQLMQDGLLEEHLSPETKQRFRMETLPKLARTLQKVAEAGKEAGEIRGDVDPAQVAEAALQQIHYALCATSFEPGFDWKGSWSKIWKFIEDGLRASGAREAV